MLRTLILCLGLTLSGAVASKAQKDKAIAVAKQIKGVKSVEASGLTLASR